MSPNRISVYVRSLLYEVIQCKDYRGVVTLAPYSNLTSPKESIYGVSSLALEAFHEALNGGWILNKSDDVDVITHDDKREDFYWIEALRHC